MPPLGLSLLSLQIPLPNKTLPHSSSDNCRSNCPLLPPTKGFLRLALTAENTSPAKQKQSRVRQSERKGVASAGKEFSGSTKLTQACWWENKPSNKAVRLGGWVYWYMQWCLRWTVQVCFYAFQMVQKFIQEGERERERERERDRAYDPSNDYKQNPWKEQFPREANGYETLERRHMWGTLHHLSSTRVRVDREEESAQSQVLAMPCVSIFRFWWQDTSAWSAAAPANPKWSSKRSGWWCVIDSAWQAQPIRGSLSRVAKAIQWVNSVNSDIENSRHTGCQMQKVKNGR